MISKQITEALEKLSNDRKIFHSEADFQFALARELQSNHPKWKVRLEKPFKFEDKKEKVYVDLVIIAGDGSCGIELKYKTKEIKDKVIDSEEYYITNHAATNLGRYDFWSDIERLYKLIRNGKLDGGMVILLTNEPNYWNNDSKGYCSHQFHLKDGRKLKKGDELNWVNEPPLSHIGKKRKGLVEIKKDYRLNWAEYSKLDPVIQFNEFKYLALEVK